MISALRTADLLGDDDVRAHFAPTFIDRVPPGAILGTFRARKAAGETSRLLAIGAGAAPVSDFALGALVQTKLGVLRVALTVEAAEPHRIESLTILPAPDADPTLATDAQRRAALAKLAPSVSMIAAAVEGERCVELESIDADRRLPIGSGFKLWIAEALTREIEGGRLHWEDGLALSADGMSLPTGEVASLPVGTPMSLERLLAAAVGESDDSAADQLLLALGRASVGAAIDRFAPAGAPPRPTVLRTREVFALKLLATDAERSAFVAATGEKRLALASEIARRPLDGAAAHDAARAWKSPRLLRDAEWFASAREQCGVLASLGAKSERPTMKPLHDALFAQPGLPDGGGYFASIGYKGGSEPGLLHIGWYLTTQRTHRPLVLVLTVVDDEKPIDVDRAVYLAGAMRDAMAKSPRE